MTYSGPIDIYFPSAIFISEKNREYIKMRTDCFHKNHRTTCSNLRHLFLCAVEFLRLMFGLTYFDSITTPLLAENGAKNRENISFLCGVARDARSLSPIIFRILSTSFKKCSWFSFALLILPKNLSIFLCVIIFICVVSMETKKSEFPKMGTTNDTWFFKRGCHHLGRNLKSKDKKNTTKKYKT